jgi:single-strand DNA-binding protein
MRVVAQGRLKQRSYETREGEKRTVVELDVEEVGPSLKYATAKVARVQRSGGGGGYSGGNTAPTGGDDPWASSPAQGGGQPAAQPAAQPANQGSWGGQQGGQAAPGGQPQNDPWATGGSDEPPF